MIPALIPALNNNAQSNRRMMTPSSKTWFEKSVSVKQYRDREKAAWRDEAGQSLTVAVRFSLNPT